MDYAALGLDPQTQALLRQAAEQQQAPAGFAPPLPVSRPPQMEPPKIPAPEDWSGFTQPRQGGSRSEVEQAVARADEVLKRLRQYEVPFPREPAPANVPMRRNAMTPTAGPDTGEENPNDNSTPAGYFRALRGSESTNNPGATNPITKAAGLYQIQPSTFAWLAKENPNAGLDPAKIYDPDQQERAVRLYTDKSMRQLVPALGRMPTSGELYALHFFGHTGGMQFLGGLDRPAKDVIRPADFAANPWLYKYADKPASLLLNQLNKMMGAA